MANQKMFQEILKREKFYGDADTVNNEGFPAYKRKDFERLREILFLGHIGNTFYVTSDINIESKIKDLKKLINRLEPTKVADLIVSARNEGLFRTIPITALALLRLKDPKEFKRIFTNVVRTGNDMVDFISINKGIADGFGRAAKSAMQKWLGNVNQFYALKYRKQIADAIALSRPPVDKFNNSLILKYAYGVKKKYGHETIKRMLKELPQIRGAEMFKMYIQQGRIDKAIGVGIESRLPADLMIGVAGNINSPELWRAIMRNMGIMQLIKYLNKLSNVLSPEEVSRYIRGVLTPENLKKAKVFPYRLFVAYINTEQPIIREALRDVINLYGTTPIIPETWRKHSWAICPDVSGSMTFAEGDIVPSRIAGFFSSVLAKQLNTDTILPWDYKVYPINVKYMDLFEVYKRIAEADGLGTAMNEPIDYLLHNRIKKDIVVIITDSEHWASIRGVKEAWRDYKKFNPTARLVVIEVVGYGTSQVDEEFAYKHDVYTVFGWSESVFKWIELKLFNRDRGL